MTHGPCQDCAGCLIKQIVNQCKRNRGSGTVYAFQDDILKLIEIEEVTE